MGAIAGMLRRRRAACACALAACLVAAGAVHGQGQELPRLETNESYLEHATRYTTLAIEDPMAVFAYVLGSLPDRVRVYPTENHYYFSFVHNGARFSGNIKIDARLREEGKASFVYYQEQPAWRDDGPDFDIVLDATQGVTIEKVEPLAYRVSYRDKSVVFALNDLSRVKPPAAALAPDEQFIGPVFDESGVRFFLVFNRRLKVFHFVLDETVRLADTLTQAPRNDRILIGSRTGFAFYREHRRDRKILIGALENNVLANNYFDGPFDQIPDNFIEGDAFRAAILAVAPDLTGKIDRFGGMADGTRYAVVPYMRYRTPSDLQVFDRCATSRRVPADRYYACFVLAADNAPGARPLAVQRHGR
jgi:hypothetical protein